MDFRHARPPAPARPSPWPLFVAQLGIGAAGLVVFFIALFVVGGSGVGVGAAGLVVLLTLAALAAAERLKTRTAEQPAPPEDYHGRLRELRSSRREIVDAFEIERRRIERDLHDGAQQYLVASSMKLGEAALLVDRVRQDRRDRRDEQDQWDQQSSATSDDTLLDEAGALLAAAQDEAEQALRALRATVSGIHPTVLTDLGLEAAIRDVVARTGLEVVVRTPHPLPPLPEGVLAAGYFFASEALTNVAKHAPAASVSVVIAADRMLHVSVVDDGPGGATITPGHGLAGMRERLAAFGGVLELSSPTGGPTTVVARIPVLLEEGEGSVVLTRPGVEEETR